MDIYTATRAYLFDLPTVKEWPEVRDLLERASLRRPYYWQLPVIACEAVGGKGGQALPGMAAIACLHTSILLLDDMLDADPKGEYHHLGQPATANMAAALQAIGLEAIAHSEQPPAIKLAILQRLNQMVLTTALGQNWDVQNPQTEAAYWRVVHTKSAPFFGTALAIGALLGGTATETAEQIEELGGLYGEMIQIQDDVSDVMETPANPDWLMGRSPLSVLYAQVVSHPDRAQFLKLRQTIADPDALAEAQLILIRCGAISYAIDQLLRRYAKAQKALADLPRSCQDKLETMFDAAMNPVQELFVAAGATQLVVRPGSF